MPSNERSWPRIVISKDGGRAILLKRPTERPYKVSGRAAAAFPFSGVLGDGTEIDIRVLTSSALRAEPAAPSWLGLPATATDVLNVLAECAIGDFLDTDEVLESESTTEIPAFSDDIENIRSRPSASDEVLHRYIAWKTYWSWKFEQHWAVFDYADQLRLARRVSQFAQMARVDDGVLWSIRAKGDEGVALRAERELLLAVREGRIGTAFFSPIFDVGELLSSPEFAAPSLHFRKALAFVSTQPVDRENAAKEAVSAVESLVQIVFQTTDTLGESVKKLRGNRALHPALAKVLEGVWGFTSEMPGVRHGSAATPHLSDSETRLIVNLCASALLFLTDLASRNRRS